MKVVADLHIHSKYSRATSSDMDLRTLERCAQLKGLNLLGTGDFTHRKWLRELFGELEEHDFGVYKRRGSQYEVYFVAQTEVNTVFEYEGRVRKIHHVILAPSLDVAEQINERLSKYGDLDVDGRPSLEVDGATLVEEVLEVEETNIVMPAHAWTPWYSIFGSRGGVDGVEECYGDKAGEVFALETGLSSDPPMNWRVSALDRFALLSNSDSHSPWPWRLGREANVFELRYLNYLELYSAIKSKDSSRFLMTLEVNPAYGKYHWTGHRSCGISLPPEESAALKGTCPACGRRLTKGVAERVEELADRPPGFKPAGAIPYKHVLPLSEIISVATGRPQDARETWEIYAKLVRAFGSELNVLLEAPIEGLMGEVDGLALKLLSMMRRGEVPIKPGYDGVYGRIALDGMGEGLPSQLKLEDFIA